MRIGIYNRYMHYKGGGEKRVLALAEAFRRDHEVLILTEEPFDVTDAGGYFGVCLDGVRFKNLEPRSDRPWIRNLQLHKWIRSLNLDLFINGTYRSELLAPIRNSIFLCMFPEAPVRGGLWSRVARWGVLGAIQRGIFRMHPNPGRSYRRVTANSRYTAEWIRSRWGVEPVVVFTACDPVADQPVAKEKLILHVGRFEPKKSQDNLIEAFGGLTALHERGWRLALAGSTIGPPEADPYIRSLREASQHLPVTFHFNAPKEELGGLYNRASIYWHATGFGSPRDPGLQEHFGITTFEAATSGAVPVVLNSGGQPEIVTDGMTGFLWNRLDELKALTRELADDPILLARMGEAARSVTSRFSRSAYVEAVSRVVFG